MHWKTDALEYLVYLLTYYLGSIHILLISLHTNTANFIYGQEMEHNAGKFQSDNKWFKELSIWNIMKLITAIVMTTVNYHAQLMHSCTADSMKWN